MKSLSLVIFWVAIASCLFAQKEVIVKKEKSADQIVTVDVMKNNDKERTIKIVTDKDGKKKVIEWTDDGKIPEDVKRQLEEAGIDVSILESKKGKEVLIMVDEDDDEGDKEVRKEVIMIKKSDDGEVEEFEWDGEGEMPEDMKNMMEEHDIELGEMHEGHGKEHKMKRIRIEKDNMRSRRHKALKDGREKNTKKRKEYKIVTIDEEGNEKVKEWTSDGDDDEFDMHFDSDGDDENVFILKGSGGHKAPKGGKFAFFNDDDVHLSDAYMGAHIESVEEGGAKIVDLIKDGPADKAGLQKGDVVKKINGARARTMDDLLSILNYFDPNDKIELNVLRNGSEKNIKLTLGKRPGSDK